MQNLYKSIKIFVLSLYSKKLQGQSLRRALKLVNIIYGIIKSHSSNLSKIAEFMQGFQQFASKVKSVKRWILSEHNEYQVHYSNFIKVLLNALNVRQLKGKDGFKFAIDGSLTGDGCVTLMMSVLFNNRSLPVCWLVKKGGKGHFTEQLHIELVNQLQEVLPQNVEPSQVVILGDGEFDGCDLQKTCNDFGWKYVLRTAKDTWFYPEQFLYEDQNKQDLLDSGFQFKQLLLPAHTEFLFFEDLHMTKKKMYGKVNAGYFHQNGYKDPIFLVSNLDDPALILYLYDHRFLIETFFSDIKSRGFNVHKSKLNDPQRIHTLLICLCLAYIFTIQQALRGILKGWKDQLTFKDKDKEASLFTIGRRMIRFCEQNCIPIRFSLSNFLSYT